MVGDFGGVIARRLKYMLSPQFDIYYSMRGMFSGLDVLEVGFGTGAGVLQYCYDAKSVDAIEPDPSAVDFAQKMFPIHNVQWIEGDITHAYIPKKYDACVMVETLEHIPEWQTALSNIWRLLVPGGKLIMTSRNNNADLRRWNELHERELTAEQLVEMLSVYFPKVELYDWSFKMPQDYSTTLTPLVAIAQKGDL